MSKSGKYSGLAEVTNPPSLNWGVMVVVAGVRILFSHSGGDSDTEGLLCSEAAGPSSPWDWLAITLVSSTPRWEVSCLWDPPYSEGLDPGLILLPLLLLLWPGLRGDWRRLVCGLRNVVSSIPLTLAYTKGGRKESTLTPLTPPVPSRSIAILESPLHWDKVPSLLQMFFEGLIVREPLLTLLTLCRTVRLVSWRH